MPRSLKRSFGFAAFAAPLVLVVAVSACGDDESGSPAVTVEIKPSSFVTTPTTAAGATTAPGGSAAESQEGEQSYEVESGDNLSAIASDFGITIDEIANFNNWTDGASHPLFAGDTIRIPPGADIPSADDETDTTDESSDESEETSDSGDSGDEEANDAELCPDGERQGTYTIQDTDTTRVGVADRLDVSVAQLDEANLGTPGYSGFFPGLEIVVPCGGESDATDTTD